MDEEVLVIEGRLLDELGSFEGFTSDVDRFLPTFLDPLHLKYLPRPSAEVDPTHKQLVPYAVLRCRDEVFCYVRGKKGGEARLHDRWSLGVGGHICREDGDRGGIAYRTGFDRELAEEVDIQSPYQERIVGLVYDPGTPVGEVHIGVIHLIDLVEPRVVAREAALADGIFRPIHEVREEKDRFESWSAFVIDHVLT